jgi:uncharacterized protein (DUF2384 family)
MRSKVPSRDLSDLFEVRLEERRRVVTQAVAREIARLKGMRSKLAEVDAEVLLAAIECLGSYERAALWLTRPEELLAGAAPLDAAARRGGKEAVIRILWRLSQCAPS